MPGVLPLPGALPLPGVLRLSGALALLLSAKARLCEFRQSLATTRVKLVVGMPARSKKQQRFFALVRACQKGELGHPSKHLKDVASRISEEDAHHFAATKHEGLPEKAAAWIYMFKEAGGTGHGKSGQFIEVDPGNRIGASRRARKILNALTSQEGDDEEHEKLKREVDEQSRKDIDAMKENADVLGRALDVIRDLVGDSM